MRAKVWEKAQMYMCTQAHAHALLDSNCRRTNSNLAQGKRKEGENKDLQLVPLTFWKNGTTHKQTRCHPLKHRLCGHEYLLILHREEERRRKQPSTCNTYFLKNGTNTGNLGVTHWSLACANTSPCSTCFLRKNQTQPSRFHPLKPRLCGYEQRYVKKENIPQCTDVPVHGETCSALDDPIFEFMSRLILR